MPTHDFIYDCNSSVCRNYQHLEDIRDPSVYLEFTEVKCQYYKLKAKKLLSKFWQSQRFAIFATINEIFKIEMCMTSTSTLEWAKVKCA